ncbi:uncharacterized protein LOC120802576 isoform X2 [Xiphias gladius]|uniref:uncharacterized protein LOC120802576 isoform X2 n=1 Tax=Xiphias gladius TaxID=8245 RepID=UPI001A980966|nr:uncharacterized protein LOC120802576 isoform X2 [Xiphias gladius]
MQRRNDSMREESRVQTMETDGDERVSLLSSWTMISIYMIITVLATALGKGPTECSFLEPTGDHQCFGAVGQPLLFHLPNTADTFIKLIKDSKYLILRAVKNQTVYLNEEYVNQSELFTTGTFNLGNTMKRHSGDYLLEEYRSDGALLKKAKVHLEIQAPVSNPAVSQMCSSPEQMEVSCSSEGDGVEFILTLDGQLLKHTRDHSLSLSNWAANMQSLTGSTAELDKSSVSNVTISLHGQLRGNLTCSVANNVSRNETVIHLKSCKDFRSSFPVVTEAAIAGIVTLLFLAALCLGIINHLNKSRPMAVNEGK